jgi:hypothetical protein
VQKTGSRLLRGYSFNAFEEIRLPHLLSQLHGGVASLRHKDGVNSLAKGCFTHLSGPRDSATVLADDPLAQAELAPHHFSQIARLGRRKRKLTDANGTLRRLALGSLSVESFRYVYSLHR